MSTPRWFDDDEQLGEELGLALAEEAPGPEQTGMIMAGYDIVMADTIEAALLHDSAADDAELAAVRSDTAGARMLAFATDDGPDGVEIEFELIGGRVVGHVDPPLPGRIVLDQPSLSGGEPAIDEPDDLGAFELPLRSTATFRLRFEAADGRTITTAWLDGPHHTGL